MNFKLLRMPFLVLSFFLFFATTAVGANDGNDLHEVNNIDLARGQSGVCALRDKQGFIWLGMLSGINCYDSNGVLVGSSSTRGNSDTNKQVNRIFEWKDKILFTRTPGLWVLHRDGRLARRFDYRTKYGVEISSAVQGIEEVEGEELWIVTYGQGLFIFNEKDSTLVQNSRNSSFYSDIT